MTAAVLAVTAAVAVRALREGAPPTRTLRKPVWLLDIDGVINAAARRPPTSVWPAGDWRVTRVDGLHILAAQPVIDFIDRVDADGLAEIRWHTTWQERALDVGDALGLPTFYVAHAPEFAAATAKTEWWKLPAAVRVLDVEERPLLWTDDDINGELSSVQIGALGRYGASLLVCPDSMIGLTRSHLRRIEAFLLSQRSEE